MRELLRDPVDRSILTDEPGGLRSAAGRHYPACHGGWDLRPEPRTDPPSAAPSGELQQLDYPHTLGLLLERELLQQLPLQPGDPVLELGGQRSGVLAWLERHRGVHGVGVDIAPDWVATQNRACVERGGRSGWVVGTAERLPFADRTFRAVVAFDVFQHLGNLRAGLEECARVLQPGGTLVCQTAVSDLRGSYDGYRRWVDAGAFAARQANKGHHHERIPSRLQMRTWLEQAGLQVLDTRNSRVWLQPLHDEVLVPALGRLRHRRDPPQRPGPPPPVRTTPSRYQRLYSTLALPLARSLTTIDEVGALAGIGGSCSYIARKPG